MIKKFLLDPAALEKWLHQNKAIYTGDFLEGCLLDSFIVSTRRGYAAIYEKYINANKSGYYVEFEAGPAKNVFSNWYKMEEAYNEQILF